MMEAKDTVIPKRHIGEIMIRVSQANPKEMGMMTRRSLECQEVARAQAEISFKAGYEKAEREGIDRLNGCKDGCALSIKDSRQAGIKEGIRKAIDNLKMHHCIVDVEARIKEIDNG